MSIPYIKQNNQYELIDIMVLAAVTDNSRPGCSMYGKVLGGWGCNLKAANCCNFINTKYMNKANIKNVN